MKDSKRTDVVKMARDYYDSSDADNFYFNIWGGEDLHIGWYESAGEDIFTASRRTVERMLRKLPRRDAGSRVLDIGAGYGGSARYLAVKGEYHVTCLNLSDVQNERNRSMNREQKLSSLVDVVSGSFEDLPFGGKSFDVAWSQDAILHSGDRFKVFQEIDRVLRPGGDFVMTDPMQRSDVSADILQPVLDRIHLASMGSVEAYQEYARELGWEFIGFEENTASLTTHYSRVLEELGGREEEMRRHCSADYIDRMKAGLAHWVSAGEQGALAWGILHFRKQ